MYKFWYQMYLAHVQAVAYVLSDNTTIMRCVPVGHVIPNIPGV